MTKLSGIGSKWMIMYFLFTFASTSRRKKLAMPDICTDREDVVNDIKDIPVRWRSMLLR